MTFLNLRSEKRREESRAMKKQEAVRQEFRRGAKVVRNLPAWMQELEQQAKSVAEKPTSLIAEKASNPRPSSITKRDKCKIGNFGSGGITYLPTYGTTAFASQFLFPTDILVSRHFCLASSLQRRATTAGKSGTVDRISRPSHCKQTVNTGRTSS